MALATTGLGCSLCIIFSKKIRLILLFSVLVSLLFVFINLKFHPHYNNYEIISSSAKHDGLVIKRQFSCNDEEICEKIDIAGVKSVRVYSVVTCGSKKGI